MPARETDPRSMGPNFYYDQMDWLSEFQKTKQWSWTILRPQLVFGVAARSPLNIIAAIGTYASISRELGIPLRFPGGVERIGEATDARLIAKAVEWVAQNKIAANQIYNITNGDIYIASYLAQDSGVIWYGTWSSAANVFSEIDARECATLGAYYKKIPFEKLFSFRAGAVMAFCRLYVWPWSTAKSAPHE